VAKNRWENLDLLTHTTKLKFVLASREDYDWAVSACRQRRLFERCPVLFSPVQGQLDPAQLAQWMLDDTLPLRFQLQLHKVLWGKRPGANRRQVGKGGQDGRLAEITRVLTPA
jgi:7-carboxy-7-deazaguanine synthase